MKRKEWVILAVVIAAVAALEVVGTGGDMEHAPGDGPMQEVPARADLTNPHESATEALEVFRTVRLHVTGMT